MSWCGRVLARFLKNEEGATFVECALMLALIVVICIVAVNHVESGPVVSEPVAVEAAQR